MASAMLKLIPVMVAMISQPGICQNLGWVSPGWQNQPLSKLATAAKRGNKRAQLELGIRYEQGRGVNVDMRRAIRLYRSAARTTRHDDLIYSPSGPNGEGRVVRVTNSSSGDGLPEARARLDALRKAERARQ